MNLMHLPLYSRDCASAGPMDKFLLSLNKRYLFPLIAVVAVLIWVVLCTKQYESYWNGTIRRVQTVDFNILHHTMPITLSCLILSGQDASIQKVLDSNFGIFGIVITDPKGENIIYRSEKQYKKASWQKELSIEYLHKSQNLKETEHFDWLTDPPPLAAQYANGSPRVYADKAIAPPPSGRIIGRVYYLREPPPPFWEDVLGSLWGNWFEFTGSKRGYVMQTLNVGAFTTCIILILLWRKQHVASKEKELESLERELVVKRKSLENLTADLASQRKRKDWLENEAERAYQRAVKLKDSLERLKEAFFFEDQGHAKPKSGYFQQQQQGVISVRPPLHPPSAVIEEIESLLPDLTNNAKILRSQAEVLHTYCSQLEARQSEMQQIIERSRAFGKSSAGAPPGAQLRSHLTPEQSAP
jgi:hypothetical protein